MPTRTGVETRSPRNERVRRVRRTWRVVVTCGAILFAGVIACAAAPGGRAGAGRLQIVRADTAALRRKLDSIADAHHGIVGYSVIDLETGARINRRGDEDRKSTRLNSS